MLRISQAGPWVANVEESWANSMVFSGLGFWVMSVPPPQKLFRVRYSSGSFGSPFWASNSCHILMATADGGARQGHLSMLD